MANRLLIGMMDGQMRLRIARPPYDVLNPYLTNEQLVIDSTWRDNFALWEYGYERMSTVVEAPIVGGTGYWHEITFSRALSYTPTAFAWEGYSTGTITPRETYVFGDRIRVLIRAKLGAPGEVPPDPVPLTYAVFATPANTPMSGENQTGFNRLLIGNHPQYGMGFYLCRRGVNVLSAGLEDMVLTSHRPPFQIDQSGVVSHLGVFPDGQGDNLGYMQYFEINLSRPRPDRPPLFYHKQNYDVAATQTPKAFTTYYRWASDSKITVTFGKYYSDARPPGFGNHNLSWWLPYTDFRYTPGGGGGGTNRICIDPQKYLQISKRNIDVLTANDSGLLFHPSKSFMHVANRFEVGTDTDINVPNNSSGIPFVYFAMIRPFATWDNIICTMGFAGDKPWSGFNPVGSAFTALNRYAYMSTATNLKQRYIVPNGLVSLWFNAIYFTKN